MFLGSHFPHSKEFASVQTASPIPALSEGKVLLADQFLSQKSVVFHFGSETNYFDTVNFSFAISKEIAIRTKPGRIKGQARGGGQRVRQASFYHHLSYYLCIGILFLWLVTPLLRISLCLQCLAEIAYLKAFECMYSFIFMSFYTICFLDRASIAN